MTHREISIGLFVDAMFSQLPSKVLRKDYVRKTSALFVKGNTQAAKYNRQLVNDGEKLAMQSWGDCQRTLEQEVSVTEIIKFTIEAEPWLIKTYRLNQKKLNRLYGNFKSDDIQFRSLRAVNAFLKNLDENIAQLKYRKGKK